MKREKSLLEKFLCYKEKCNEMNTILRHIENFISESELLEQMQADLCEAKTPFDYKTLHKKVERSLKEQKLHFNYFNKKAVKQFSVIVETLNVLLRSNRDYRIEVDCGNSPSAGSSNSSLEVEIEGEKKRRR